MKKPKYPDESQATNEVLKFFYFNGEEITPFHIKSDQWTTATNEKDLNSSLDPDEVDFNDLLDDLIDVL